MLYYIVNAAGGIMGAIERANVPTPRYVSADLHGEPVNIDVDLSDTLPTSPASAGSGSYRLSIRLNWHQVRLLRDGFHDTTMWFLMWRGDQPADWLKRPPFIDMRHAWPGRPISSRREPAAPLTAEAVPRDTFEAVDIKLMDGTVLRGWR